MHTQIKKITYLLLVIFAGLAFSSGAYAENPDYPDNCSSPYVDMALNSSIDGYITRRDIDVFRITVP